MLENLKEKFIVGFTPAKAIILTICVSMFIGILVFIAFNLKTMKENEANETQGATSRIEQTVNEVYL